MRTRTWIALFLALVGVVLWLPITSVLMVLAMDQWGQFPLSVVLLAGFYYWRDFSGSELCSTGSKPVRLAGRRSPCSPPSVSCSAPTGTG